MDEVYRTCDIANQALDHHHVNSDERDTLINSFFISCLTVLYILLLVEDSSKIIPQELNVVILFAIVGTQIPWVVR